MNSFQLLHLIVLILVEVCSSQQITPQELTGPWSCVTCYNAGYTDKGRGLQARWDYAGATQAFNALWAQWKNNPGKGNDQFSNFAATSFGIAATVQCNVIGQGSNCNSDSSCIDPPAYDAIFRSFVWINTYHYNLYQGLVDGWTATEGNLGAFSNEFALQVQAVKSGFLDNLAFIDIIAMGLAVATAFSFNIALAGLEVGTAVSRTMAKDTLTPMLVQTSNTIKDSLKKLSDENAFNALNSIDEILALFVKTCKETVTSQLSFLFGGTDQAIQQLFDLMVGGKLFDATISDQPQVATKAVEANYGYLIPMAWSLSNQGYIPIVLDGGSDCSHGTWFDYLNEARTCVNNHWYFLVNCGWDGLRMSLGMLPGIDNLQNGFYGIKTGDIVAGSVNSFQHNGNQNGWAPMDVTNPDVLFSLLTGTSGVTSPGAITIPFYDENSVVNCRSR